jgi:hypothetical protein
MPPVAGRSWTGKPKSGLTCALTKVMGPQPPLLPDLQRGAGEGGASGRTRNR